MTIKEQLFREIESASEDILEETLLFLRFLKTKNDHTNPNGNTTESQVLEQDAAPIIRGSKAEDLLKFAGTWQGDDFEECLQLVYESRSQAEF